MGNSEKYYQEVQVNHGKVLLKAKVHFIKENCVVTLKIRHVDPVPNITGPRQLKLYPIKAL